ncbi:uncharacterized protein LOC143023641 [Oratosquilla oratoria]|uniref:uncharacterized protein LOC143023641 n=1 Tax=Oratosquilla oratoria TaxID=337810 RepID=UPI003F75EC26
MAPETRNRLEDGEDARSSSSGVRGWSSGAASPPPEATTLYVSNPRELAKELLLLPKKDPNIELTFFGECSEFEDSEVGDFAEEGSEVAAEEEEEEEDTAKLSRADLGPQDPATSPVAEGPGNVDLKTLLFVRPRVTTTTATPTKEDRVPPSASKTTTNPTITTTPPPGDDPSTTNSQDLTSSAPTPPDNTRLSPPPVPAAAAAAAAPALQHHQLHLQQFPIRLLLLLSLLLQPCATLWTKTCSGGLGMESGEIPDDAITASTSHAHHVGPHTARVRVEISGGAWCPIHQVNFTTREYLQVDLGSTHVITGTGTQGRFDNNNGKEYTEHYQLQYWRQGFTEYKTYTNGSGDQFSNKDAAGKLGNIQKKIYNFQYAVDFNNTCLQENLLP